MKIRNLTLALLPLALASCTAASQRAASAPPAAAQTFTAGMVSAADPRAAEAGVPAVRVGRFGGAVVRFGSDEAPLKALSATYRGAFARAVA